MVNRTAENTVQAREVLFSSFALSSTSTKRNALPPASKYSAIISLPLMSRRRYCTAARNKLYR